MIRVISADEHVLLQVSIRHRYRSLSMYLSPLNLHLRPSIGGTRHGHGSVADESVVSHDKQTTACDNKLRFYSAKTRRNYNISSNLSNYFIMTQSRRLRSDSNSKNSTRIVSAILWQPIPVTWSHSGPTADQRRNKETALALHSYIVLFVQLPSN